jgi:serine/threonine protein kinase
MIKLADFGLSRRLTEVSNSNKDVFGMVPYIDPQCIKKQKRPNKKSDVYSVGVLLWEISSGRKPFESHDNIYAIALINEILNGKRENPVSGTPIGYIKIYSSMFIMIS